MSLDQVTNLDQRESESVRVTGRRVDRGRPGRSFAAAKHVRADHEETVGVQRAARTDDVVPPAGTIRIVAFVETGGMRVTGKCVTDEDRIRSLGVQRAVGLVCDFDLRESGPGGKSQRAVAGEDDRPFGLDLSYSRYG